MTYAEAKTTYGVIEYNNRSYILLDDLKNAKIDWFDGGPLFTLPCVSALDVSGCMDAPASGYDENDDYVAFYMCWQPRRTYNLYRDDQRTACNWARPYFVDPIAPQ